MSGTKKQSMLVVDDEKTLVWAMRECFEVQGMDVTTAENVTDAVKAIDGSSFEVIITDLKMPDGSGIDVARAAREKNPDAVVIILTAFGSFDSAVEALRLGVDDYLSKPFRIDSLNMAVGQALEKRKAAGVASAAKAVSSSCGNYSFRSAFPVNLNSALGGELFCDSPACGEFFDIACGDDNKCTLVLGRIESAGPESDRLSLLVAGYLSAMIENCTDPLKIFSNLAGFLREKGADDVVLHCFAARIDFEESKMSYCSSGDVLVFFHNFKARNATILASVSAPAIRDTDAVSAVKATHIDISNGDQLLLALSNSDIDETLSVNLVSKIEHEIKLKNIKVAESAHDFIKEINGGSPSVVSLGLNQVMGKEKHVRVELDSENKAVIWEAKSLVEMLCRELCMDEMDSHALVSACLEIVINSMVHAYSDSKDKIVFEISRSEDSVTISIQDFGCGFDLRKYRRPSTASVEDVLDPDSRRGLFIAQNCVEKLEIASSPKSGTVVKLTQPLAVAGAKK